ncbi:protein lin-52 homolog isoform X2 [Toxorhynchites rutilus septentrionalis]|uniref:protein lin-52 homolog isoform X2 n=1 Tax=Toxorhynchites rutilus septentrionalis TaxID=329112 RepID=UPI00247A13DD|nr:protein lin-52 homolog isoform X2 [Toxorhynchites rutilus septentrionalis]
MTDSDEQKSAVLIKEETDDEESNLMSLEKLDRESPELWPEKLKGTDVSTPGVDFSPPAWTKGLTQDDINSMYRRIGCSLNQWYHCRNKKALRSGLSTRNAGSK